MNAVSGIAGPDVDIITVASLLANESLRIPVYQRPYKWTRTNIDRLLADLADHIALRGAGAAPAEYRLGTLVVYRNEHGDLEIVDGQQRYLTLLLVAHVLASAPGFLGLDGLAEVGGTVKHMLSIHRFPSAISHQNLAGNHAHIKHCVASGALNQAIARQLLCHCTLVFCTLKKLPEAFQFFDSQNARGKPLQPHDLLKAFHLREALPVTEEIAQDVAIERAIIQWESVSETRLPDFFDRYLARARQWQRGSKAQTFSSKDIGLFKGFTPSADSGGGEHGLRYSRPWHLANAACKEGDAHPFQLDQPIINGLRFFEWVNYYHQRELHHGSIPSWLRLASEEQSGGRASRILTIIDTYSPRLRNRAGDRYVRELFNAFVLAYTDRFGCSEICPAIEAAFIWSWSVRLRLDRVSMASIENHVQAWNPFIKLRDATRPVDFLREIPRIVIDKSRIEGTDLKEICALFQEMGHVH